jgi:hypothetical protein
MLHIQRGILVFLHGKFPIRVSVKKSATLNVDFRYFLQPSREIPGKYSDAFTTASFQIRSRSLFLYQHAAETRVAPLNRVQGRGKSTSAENEFILLRTDCLKAKGPLKARLPFEQTVEAHKDMRHLGSHISYTNGSQMAGKSSALPADLLLFTPGRFVALTPFTG